MRYKKNHPWDLSPTQAIRIQHKLKRKIRFEPWPPEPPRLIAGADVSFKNGKARAAVVVVEYPGLKPVERVSETAEISYPYIPGLLTFREGPALERCFKALEVKPDVVIFDGQGIAHPRNMGIATHLGILLDKATIGCAKTWLCGAYADPANIRGAFAYLFDAKKNKIGAVLRTRDNVKAVYVSPGHRMDIAGAVRIVLLCTKRYRLPEPLRLAHQLTRNSEACVVNAQ